MNESAPTQRQRLLDDSPPAELLRRLVDAGLADLPRPGHGRTPDRWRALSEVAAHDLSLAKLFEGHTDALAVLSELDDAASLPPGSRWSVWAAEPPGDRVIIEPSGERALRLNGRKRWCSGAEHVTHALMTAWQADGSGPFLVKVALGQSGVRVSRDGWQAVGMAGSASVDVDFRNAIGERVGEQGDYLARPGFWQGGAGIAACWYGGAMALGQALREAVAGAASGPPQMPASPLRAIALGRVDLALQQTAALLRLAAEWIDQHPHDDAGAIALRVRLSAEHCAGRVLDEVGRALGPTPFCRDARFARMAADLPIFVRQSGADRDFAALGDRVAADRADTWAL
jgi:hypothetical protein